MNKEILAPGIVLYRSNIEEVTHIFNKIEPSLEGHWNQAKAVNPETLEIEVSQSRKCYDFAIDAGTGTALQQDLYGVVDSWISSRVSDFVKTYSIEKLTQGPYVFLKYNQTDKFDWHIDDGNRFPRTVSVSAYLNEDYDGGEIEFQHFGISHKPKAGDIIVFGSSFSYMHRVKPVTDGTRYAVVNWYRYDGYPIQMGNISV